MYLAKLSSCSFNPLRTYIETIIGDERNVFTVDAH